jgi:hypothetical protein
VLWLTDRGDRDRQESKSARAGPAAAALTRVAERGVTTAKRPGALIPTRSCGELRRELGVSLLGQIAPGRQAPSTGTYVQVNGIACGTTCVLEVTDWSGRESEAGSRPSPRLVTPLGTRCPQQCRSGERASSSSQPAPRLSCRSGSSNDPTGQTTAPSGESVAGAQRINTAVRWPEAGPEPRGCAPPES